MAAKKVDVYVDLLSGDQLLMPGLHHPMKLGENGMMYQVKSKLAPIYWTSKRKSIDLVKRYDLVPLVRINCLAMFDAYMDHYLETVVSLSKEVSLPEGISMSEKDVESVKRKIYGDLGDLQTRFSDFKFYNGNESHDCLTQGSPFPCGMLVVADTASHPPTFYYLARGMLGRADQRFVDKRSGPNLPLYLPNDSESEEEEEEVEEGEEEEKAEGEEEVGEKVEGEEAEGEESEVEEEGEDEVYDLADKIKGLPANDDYFNSNRSRYVYHPSWGPSYWGGLGDNKLPETLEPAC